MFDFLRKKNAYDYTKYMLEGLLQNDQDEIAALESKNETNTKFYSFLKGRAEGYREALEMLNMK